MTSPERAAAAFTGAYGRRPDGVWFAPGRVNVIGEHTDYNDGFVLPAALQVGVATAAGRRGDRVLRVRSLQQADAVECDVTTCGPGDVSGWGGYVSGVLWALRESGHPVGGLDLLIDGDVPAGAGLSSSAAIECAVALACRDLFGVGLDRPALAAIARRGENDFVGAPTGVMDQLASLCARAGHLLFVDTRSLTYEHVPFDLAAYGLALLVVDSRAPHRLVEGEYAERRRSCEQGAKALGVPALRDVPLDGLDEALARLDDDVVRRRVRHVVTENARVLDVVRALRTAGDPRHIGPLLTASHQSMRVDFEITVPQVDLIVDTALATGAYGSRMTGDGFGGSVIALVQRDDVDPVVRAVEQALDARGFDAAEAFVARPANGARRVT